LLVLFSWLSRVLSVVDQLASSFSFLLLFKLPLAPSLALLLLTWFLPLTASLALLILPSRVPWIRNVVVALSFSFTLPQLFLAALLTLLLLSLATFFPLATLLALLELPPMAFRVTRIMTQRKRHLG